MCSLKWCAKDAKYAQLYELFSEWIIHATHLHAPRFMTLRVQSLAQLTSTECNPQKCNPRADTLSCHCPHHLCAGSLAGSVCAHRSTWTCPMAALIKSEGTGRGQCFRPPSFFCLPVPLEVFEWGEEQYPGAMWKGCKDTSNTALQASCCASDRFLLSLEKSALFQPKCELDRVYTEVKVNTNIMPPVM